MNENEKTRVAEVSTPTTERSKKHFSALDFGLLVVIILVVLGVGFRVMIANWIVRSAPEETVKISFKAEGITPEQLAQMKTSDVFTCEDEAFAVLGTFRSEKAKKTVEKKESDGSVSFVLAEDSLHNTVYGTLEVKGYYTDSGFVCQDDLNLYVGKILNIDSLSYSITVIITEIPRK